MIVGLGIDVVELGRIERIWDRYGTRFASKILTVSEQQALPASPIAYLASRFAAKEAAVKALGTGFRNGITFHSLAVRSLPSGQPELILHGRASERAKELGVANWLISLSHSQNTVCAVVILEN